MAEQEDHIPSCPFCEFTDQDTYFLLQHIELCHPENGNSPFIAEDDQSHEATTTKEPFNTPPGAATPPRANSPSVDIDANQYVECPADCGEAIAIGELASHLDFHSAEGLALEEAALSSIKSPSYDKESSKPSCDYDDADDLIPMKLAKTIRDRDRPRKGVVRDTAVQPKPFSQKRRRRHGSNTAHRPTAGRKLSKAELGPHANEKQMPAWLRKMLESSPRVAYENRIRLDGSLVKVEVLENERKGVIPVLRQLSQLDESVERAFFCDPNVRHVFKMSKEGGFCGYRNIQMLISYIKDAKAAGVEQFPGKIPTILQLQDMIEHAWDMGFNSNGRDETGGIRGTRKYIGTSEACYSAQALFSSLEIRCQAAVFIGTTEQSAHQFLLEAIASYFLQSCTESVDIKVCQTTLPPIYFQHSGHSLTIIGFELRKNGSSNLLVLDPMFKTSPAIQRLTGTRVSCENPGRILKAHRRCDGYLRRYNEFEILKLFPHEKSGS
ncbi:hypothetical protein LOZ58_000716 [Ophidiomyces ophidiicola]|nr:hypothetical protein LOZ58_000716 [Ophidiomyces ophidiicola]